MITSNRPFAHLHCHTHYSLLDGATRIPDLVQKVKANGMDSVAITDHGNLFGAIEFYNTCKQHDVNPIIGYEAYIAPGDRRDKKASRMKEASFHLTLLAMNRTGFENLVKLASMAYLEGFYYKPRIDKKILEEHNEGLICLSGCAAGELSQLILSDRMDEARKLTEWYATVFGNRFYMEIQNAGLEIQKLCADGTIDLANSVGLPLVATNDAHYLEKEDADAHDILLCVNTRSQRTDEKRMRMTGDEFFIRTPEQMYAAFPDHADAVARTQEIANRVDIDLDLTAKHYPVFKPPGEKTDTEYLRELCEERLVSRYGDELTDAHRERLDHELKIIDQMGYSSYFLIVWDFVRFAQEHKIPCQARGSACGAIVAYLLGLSNVCPLKYDLLFERFLDPSRSEPPDIDIDFCRDRRQMVIDFTKEKYGENNVAQIGTFGTLKAKAAIRDVSRALAIPLPRVDEICKMVPDTLNIKLKDALKESADLQDAYNQDPQIKEMLDIAMRLEGLARSAGTHAAGVVVSDKPLSERIPLQTITGKTDIITQWDGPTVEQVGLLKMDFLGLRNLTILDKAVQNVKKHRGVEIDPIQLPLDDKETFALLQRGETKGIFQLESGGMRDLLTKMRPDSFSDIIATSALYRPGPLEGGMVMDYVNVKNGRQEPAKVHPIVDEVLAETYGVMVYQEQVMRILNRVGNIELSSAYRCIKAISKKKEKIIASFHEEYIEGAKANGIEESLAEELFELIKKFAGYGFNKSHSTAYGAVAYQTAYLKAHYPVEFMAALLSCGMESSDRISEHVEDARRMGITVLPPDVNQSDVEFGVLQSGENAKVDCNGSADAGKTSPGTITFGLGAVKGVGETAVAALVEERIANGPFKSIFDLTERVDPKVLTKGVLEILIKAGALDSLGPNRAQHMNAVERAVQAGAAIHRDRARGQKSLFGDDDEPTESESDSGDATLPDANDWTNSQKLAAEKEVFGFYLTSHPVTQHAERLAKYASHTTRELADLDDKDEVILGGMISAIKRVSTKKPSRNGHSRYANFDLEDAQGIVRCIIWPEQFVRYEELVKQEQMVFVIGKVDRRGREPNIIVDRLLTLDDAERDFTQQVAIQFQKGRHTREDMQRVHDTLQRFPGQTDVVLIVDSALDDDSKRQFRSVITAPTMLRVSCSRDLQTAVTEVLGDGCIQFHAAKRRRNGRAQSIGR
ncbi:MAG: DNA polymerase III subunit alpha [Planctomycetaceae bacterium]